MGLILAAAAVLLSGLAAVLAFLVLQAVRRPAAVHPEVFGRLAALETELARVPGLLREEVRGLRTEMGETLGRQDGVQDTRFRNLAGLLDQRLAGFGQSQADQIAGLRRETAEGQARFDDALKRETAAFAHAQTTGLGETNRAMETLAERLERAHADARTAQRLGLERVTVELKGLTEGNAAGQTGLRDRLTAELDKLREENGRKLDEMRATVDEKLQGTLEKRLGESFQIVSERLDTVHKSMGEMQTLATGVGDLKRVLINVKSRGAWGEVQLGALLEDMLSPDQYDRQVALETGSREAVDYAVRLPGQSDDGPLWLPIDCKFPHEDYDRLLAAQDLGDPAAIDAAGKALERAIRVQARSIGDKYVRPPRTTPFAIMYLPTEGLYAEVIRRPGLMADLQKSCNVTVAGPTTLTAILDGLRMGFRTLALAKRSNEIGRVLGEVKAEFEKYGAVWDKLVKQLDTAKNTAEEAGKRTRAVGRKLRGVEAVEAVQLVGLDAPPALPPPVEEEDEAA